MRASGALVVAFLSASRAIAAPDAAALRIDLDPPTALGSDAGGMVFLSGRALAGNAGVGGLDLVLALDTSDSTDEAAYEAAPPATAGSPSPLSRFLAWLGLSKPATQTPTIFSEELRAARAVLADLDPGTSRVAIVLLAGEAVGGSGGPVTALPLSSDFARARLLLDYFEVEGPGGNARWSAGLRRSVALLVGIDAAPAAEPEVRRRALLVLTDARLAPDEQNDPDLDATLAQARRANVRVNALVFGEEALRGAPLVKHLVMQTGGRTLTVTRATDALVAATALDHARVARLEVWNDTLAEPARALARRPDGSFGSLVRLAPGENRITVVARGWNGLESRRDIRVNREAVATTPELVVLEPASLALRGRLLREWHERQIAASTAPRPRDLRVAPDDAKSEAAAPPAAATPAD